MVFLNRYSQQLSLNNLPRSSFFMKRLSALRFWDWQFAFRNWEILLQLPFEAVCRCICGGLCADGTMQSIRLKNLCVPDLPVEDNDHAFIPFQQYTLIKSNKRRTDITAYDLISSNMTPLTLNYWNFSIAFVLAWSFQIHVRWLQVMAGIWGCAERFALSRATGIHSGGSILSGTTDCWCSYRQGQLVFGFVSTTW